MTDQLLLDLDEHTDSWWRSTAMQALEYLAATGNVFDAYSLTELGVPDPPSMASLGALFYAARQAGLIHKVGYAPSRRPATRGSAAAQWVGQ